MRHAAASELGLARDAQRSEGRSDSNHDGSSAEVERLAVQHAPVADDFQAGGGIHHELGAGGFGLLLDQRAQVEARHALWEPGKVLDLFDVEYLAATGQVLDEHAPQAA